MRAQIEYCPPSAGNVGFKDPALEALWEAAAAGNKHPIKRQPSTSLQPEFAFEGLTLDDPFKSGALTPPRPKQHALTLAPPCRFC